MERHEAEKMLDGLSGKHYRAKNVVYIGKLGTTEVRPVNVDEITAEKFQEYLEYLVSRE